jgi:Protein of unknown function (DUF1360)
MPEPSHLTEPRPTAARARQPYLALILLYQLGFAAFLLAYRRKSASLERMTPLDLATLGLATLRIAKVISEDEITSVLREPLVEEAEGSKRPRRAGWRWALGKLVLCPTCTGTWVAAFLGYSLHLFPRETRPLLAIMSASGIEQFSDAALSLVYADRDKLRQQE